MGFLALGFLSGPGLSAFVVFGTLFVRPDTGFPCLRGLVVLGVGDAPAVIGLAWRSALLLRYPLGAACVTIGLGILFGVFLVLVAVIGVCFSLYRALVGLRWPLGPGSLLNGLCGPGGPVLPVSAGASVRECLLGDTGELCVRPFGAACLTSGFCAPSSPLVIAGSFRGR